MSLDHVEEMSLAKGEVGTLAFESSRRSASATDVISFAFQRFIAARWP